MDLENNIGEFLLESERVGRRVFIRFYDGRNDYNYNKNKSIQEDINKQH